MTLVTRLLVFVLGTLAVVLVGFSLALYAAADTYLNRQATERVEAALQRLVAAVEVEDGRVEWEPHTRELHLDASDAGGLSWRVIDESGRVIDRSASTPGENLVWPAMRIASFDVADPVFTDSADGDWRFAVLRVAAGKSRVPSPPAAAMVDDSAPQQLLIQTAMPLGPVRALLARLAWLLTGLSFSLWLLAAVGGRAICRRALSPLTAMAAAARTIKADALSRRLPEPKTRDECQNLARAFNELLSRVEDAFERQRQFTGNASHQLRTPLAAITGQVEVALRRDRTAEEYRRVLDIVHNRIGGLSQLVETLLFLARADGESLLPDWEPVDLENWLGERIRKWAKHPRACDMRLELEAKGGLSSTHPVLLGQLLDNLLENACKHSPNGSTIIIRLTRKNGTLLLEVEDLGEGIASCDLPHVFEPFYRSPRARSRGLPGAGVGLAVVERIARALGGRLSVKSRLGAGSCFQLYLPELGEDTRIAQVGPIIAPTNLQAG